MNATDRFGRYRVIGLLGSGGMGHVYEAVDDVLGRSVAVKTLHGSATGLGARMLDERFRLEARAVAALNHPGIVQVYDLDLTATPPYLVMERMAGPSLKDRIARGPLPAAELRALGIQMAQALAAAHAAGIVHRDVKPANILAAAPGVWKLADFGVAHTPDSSLTMSGQFMGSPAFAPPEALLRGQSTAAGDVFGLGASLYHAAVGHWPRAEATTGGLLAAVPSVRTLVPTLPADLVATIDRAVELEPDARPSAAALADALARGGSLPVMAPLPTRRRAVPWQLLAVAGAVLLVAVVGITRSPRTTRPAAAPAPVARFAPAAAASPAAIPTEIRVQPPAMSERRAGDDWNKVMKELQAQKFSKARKKLGEWERRWGETAETRDLQRQLAAIPAEHPDDD